ncbi:MAG: hypothetical protein ABIH50_05490 [bacterium]
MKKGNALLIVIVIISTLLLLAGILTKIVYNNYAGTVSLVKREEAWWLAEAGIAAGKVELAHNPNWYTDLPHAPENDFNWLKDGAVGKRGSLGSGEYKIVREKDQEFFYAVGEKSGAAVILRIEFTASPMKYFRQKEI